MNSTKPAPNPMEEVEQMLTAPDTAHLAAFLERIGPAETARMVSRLSVDDRNRLLTLLDPHKAAEVIEDVPEAQAVGLIESLPPQEAAHIVDEMHSDVQADVLGDLHEQDAEAILEQMDPQEAAEARQLMAYEPDTAGGLMVTEYLAYDQHRAVSDVLTDLRTHHAAYADYDVQYVYVIDTDRLLIGVLRMRDMLFAPPSASLERVMIRDVLSVRANDTVDQLTGFFDHHNLFGAPVVNNDGVLVGIVQRSAVAAATVKEADHRFLGISGIVGGEEFRSMPTWVRSGRRLSWLSINIVLNIIAASVIAVYQDTLSAVIALAVFLPMISDMSGCSGNQAVAVSMRELTLGLVRAGELARVAWKEAVVGVINGCVLGLLLGLAALAWKGNPTLGLVVGAALAVNTIVAVTIGGLLPLIMKGLRLDPALVSGPILTTVTDMCGFFLVLSLATAVLPQLVT